MLATRRQTDASIDDGGPVLKQHCINVSRPPYSQQHALQCLRVYTCKDNIDLCLCVLCLYCLFNFNTGQHRRRRTRLFAIEYLNKNTVHIHNICF